MSAASVERPNDMWNALIDYAIESDEPETLLRLWREGSFDEIRSCWPDFPEAAFPKEARR